MDIRENRALPGSLACPALPGAGPAEAPGAGARAQKGLALAAGSSASPWPRVAQGEEEIRAATG